MDVQQTGYKKLVIHHDFLIDWHTDMRGQIYDMTMERAEGAGLWQLEGCELQAMSGSPPCRKHWRCAENGRHALSSWN